MKWTVMINDNEGTRELFEEHVGESIYGLIEHGMLCRVDNVKHVRTGQTANLVRFKSNIPLFLHQVFSLNVCKNANPIYFGWPDEVIV